MPSDPGDQTNSSVQSLQRAALRSEIHCLPATKHSPLELQYILDIRQAEWKIPVLAGLRCLRWEWLPGPRKDLLDCRRPSIDCFGSGCSGLRAVVGCIK